MKVNAKIVRNGILAILTVFFLIVAISFYRYQKPVKTDEFVFAKTEIGFTIIRGKLFVKFVSKDNSVREDTALLSTEQTTKGGIYYFLRLNKKRSEVYIWMTEGQSSFTSKKWEDLKLFAEAEALQKNSSPSQKQLRTFYYDVRAKFPDKK